MTDVCTDFDILTLLREARQLPHGPEKVAVMERATQLADAAGQTVLAFSAREGLIEAAEFSGSPEKTLSAFAWCLAQCDRDPKRFPVSRILWQYKWVADKLYIFPNMERETIARTLDDIERRFRENRWGSRGPHKLRLIVAMGMGDLEAARNHYRRWTATRRDTGSDCPACDQRARTRYFQFVGDDRRAAEAAQPVLDGRFDCADEPHRTTCLSMRSLLRVGRVDDAIECYERTRRRLRPTSSLYDEVAEHIEFLVLTGNCRRAVTLLERHTARALSIWDFDARFGYLLAGLLLVRSLKRTRPEKVRLRFVGSTPLNRPDGQIAITEAERWLESECRTLADAFDRRNDNDWFHRRLAGVDETLARQSVVELS